MLIAVLESARSSVERDIEFSRGVFTAEGLGELSVEDLRELDSRELLGWISDDMRALALGYSHEAHPSSIESMCLPDTQMQLAVETEVVYVPPHRMGSKTEAELKRIVADMNARGWVLVEDTRMGASGGHLTFQRAEPVRASAIASRYAG